ncbi:MAG: HlyC/CorC family transporter [Syntrophomonadaceae bacterium]|jgi:putative hemolysin|nr:HlyC/CorC family transporter [Syntrophomonadaceae bacterium]
MVSTFLFLLVLIILNAFFAASEIALVSLNEAKIKSLDKKGNKKAKLVSRLLNDPSRFLATIQIGVTLAGFLASAFASQTFADSLVHLLKLTGVPLPEIWLKSFSVVLITMILAYFTLVLGELVPKRVAMKKAEPIAFLAARPLNALSALAYPFVTLLSKSTNLLLLFLGLDPNKEDNQITEEEIRMMLDIGEEKGAIHKTEKQMINNVFEFNNKTVGHIMTHRTDIAALPIEATLNQVVLFVDKEKFSRIPVYQDTLDNIVGILYAKDLFRFLSNNSDQQFSLGRIIRQPYFVPDSKRTDELFRELQKKKIHIAIVIDEHGGTAGLVTIEDLLEEIVGNIFDEYDEEERDFNQLDENTFLIRGSASLSLVQDYLNIRLPIEEYETLSGFLIGQLGRIPKKDDRPLIEYNDLVFKIEAVDDKRISMVKVGKA